MQKSSRHQELVPKGRAGKVASLGRPPGSPALPAGPAAVGARLASPLPVPGPPWAGLGRSLLRGELGGIFAPTETTRSAASASGPSRAGSAAGGPTHLAALPARPAAPHRGEPNRTEPDRTAPCGAAPDRAAPRSTEQSRAQPSGNLLSCMEQDRHRERTGASSAVPAARLAGRRGARQSPARAGPVPAGNPSPARPDWKSPAGCAGWAGPGLLSLNVMRRQIWAGPREPAAPAPRPPRPGMPLGLSGKRLGLNGAGQESQRSPGPAPGGGTDVVGDFPAQAPTRWSGTDTGGRSTILDPGLTQRFWTSPGGQSPTFSLRETQPALCHLHHQPPWQRGAQAADRAPPEPKSTDTQLPKPQINPTLTKL